MAKKINYQYSVWYRDGKDSDKDKMIKGVTDVEATSVDHAKLIAIRSLTEQEAGDDLSKLEVVVRPFS